MLDFLKELSNRTKHPLRGTFFVTFLILNWDILTILIFDVYFFPELAVKEFKETLWNESSRYWIPILSMIIYPYFIEPFANSSLQWVLAFYNRVTTNLLEIEDRKILREKVRFLENNFENLNARYAELLSISRKDQLYLLGILKDYYKVNKLLLLSSTEKLQQGQVVCKKLYDWNVIPYRYDCVLLGKVKEVLHDKRCIIEVDNTLHNDIMNEFQKSGKIKYVYFNNLSNSFECTEDSILGSFNLLATRKNVSPLQYEPNFTSIVQLDELYSKQLHEILKETNSY